MRESYVLRSFNKYVPIIDLKVNKREPEIRGKMRENHSQAGRRSLTNPTFWFYRGNIYSYASASYGLANICSHQ